MTSKDEILRAIRFQAAKNGGVALGRDKFSAITGIPVSAWYGVHWAFWNDAVTEAGFEPNSWKQRLHGEENLVRKLAELTLELGHYPATGERGIKRKSDPTFPSRCSRPIWEIDKHRFDRL